MGVDIYGKKDKWIGVKPEIDWGRAFTRSEGRILQAIR